MNGIGLAGVPQSLQTRLMRARGHLRGLVRGKTPAGVHLAKKARGRWWKDMDGTSAVAESLEAKRIQQALARL